MGWERERERERVRELTKAVFCMKRVVLVQSRLEMFHFSSLQIHVNVVIQTHITIKCKCSH